ncbi:MAG: FGGY-family carbohydrate kinase [Hyphomicrobiaceae bacterium]
MRCYLGIDIGTFESKGVLVAEDGSILASAARPHKMLVPEPGWAEHRPVEHWWNGFTELSQRLIAEARVAPKDIRAVGASAIGPCMLPVDADGAPLMNGVLYGVDTRAAKEIEELTTQIGADRILEVSGNALTSQSVGPKILWLKRARPDLYAKARQFLTSTSYLVHRLTGAYVIDHYTASGTSPLYDPAALAYTDAFAAGITPLDRLPEPRWTTDVVGGVTAAAAVETGLLAGTPVIAGTVDAAAEALSVGVLAPGDMMLMYGSTIFIIEITAERVQDARLWYAPWLFPGQHAAMSGLATSGTLTHWFREHFARDLEPSVAVGELLAEAAASPPGARGLVLLPYFSGERTPIHDPHARGVLFGLDLTHGRGDVYRALLEGNGHATRHILDTYAEIGVPPTTIYAVGGGTKNAVWSGATSDISGRPQVVREKTIGAAYGDAFLAALGVGDVHREAITDWNPVARTIHPDPSHVDVYGRAHGIFRALYPRTRDLMRAVSTEGQ